MESDGAVGSGGKPKAGLPPLPQALEILEGFPHFPMPDDSPKVPETPRDRLEELI
jgi:hypothetical protein